MSPLEPVVQRLKAEVPIAEVVGRVVALKAAGRGKLRGLCPFHAEKTPSFYVDVAKGLFYCFGCKAGGDVFAFLQRSEGLDFKQAVRLLAEERGVEVEPPSPAERLLAAAQREFTAHRGVAADLLSRRGFAPETLEAFGVGYARRPLLAALKDAGFAAVEAAEELRRLQLLRRREGGGDFDLLHTRVTIPVYSPSGDLLGWQGRATRPSPAKYLTLVKSRQQLTTSLFGLPQARAALQATGEAVLLEGPLDVMALHQMGEKNALGLLGSSLHDAQLELLSRLGVSRVYLAFDGDEAGIRATLAALGLELARRFLVQVVRLPQGVDPADTLPTRAWGDYKARAVPEVAYRVRWALEGLDPRSAQGQRAAIERLQPQIGQSLDPVAEALRRELAAACGLGLRELERHLALKPRRQAEAPAPPAPDEGELVAGLLAYVAAGGVGEEAEPLDRLDYVFRASGGGPALLQAGLEALVQAEYDYRAAQRLLAENYPRLARAMDAALLRPRRPEAALAILRRQREEAERRVLQAQVRQGSLDALDALARLKGRA